MSNGLGPMIFFGDDLQCSNQTDVSLTSALDLNTHIKSKGKVKTNIIRLPVDQCIIYIYIYICLFVQFTVHDGKQNNNNNNNKTIYNTNNNSNYSTHR